MSAAPDLGMVVNFYANAIGGDGAALLVDSTVVSLRLLVMTEVVGPVVLVDGSPARTDVLAERCRALGVEYVHDGRELSYAEAYNLGWRRLDTPFVGLMANDVLPHPRDSMALMLAHLRREDVGCVCPYLATGRRAADEVQRPGFLTRSRITCEPGSMTLNLNLFRRDVLDRIGGIDERYRASYAEPLLLIGIRRLGYRVLLVGSAQAYHYDRLTKTLGASTIDAALGEEDTARWFREFPEFASRDGIANLALWRWPFATTPLARALWWLCYCLPSFDRRTMKLAMWVEPFLTRYPARDGRARTPHA